MITPAGSVINSPGKGGGGAVPARTTATITTSVLATNASQSGSVTLTQSFTLLQITFSCNARVELYSTSAFQVADASRAWGTLPTAYAQNGLCCDVQVSSGTMPVTWTMSPAAPGFNADSVPSGTIYYKITNVAASRAVTITLTYVETES
jgi:hypothetical protein